MYKKQSETVIRQNLDLIKLEIWQRHDDDTPIYFFHYKRGGIRKWLLPAQLAEVKNV